jgi:hypothetical protein
VIVNYGDFKFVKDEGYLALAHAPEGEEPKVLSRVHVGDSLADHVARAWTHSDAPAAVLNVVRDL